MTFSAFTAVEFAGIAVSTTNSTMIVLEMVGGSPERRWSSLLPSLPADTAGMLDQTIFLDFQNEAEAVETFQRLIQDCVDAGPDGTDEGSITLVARPWGEDDGTENRSFGLRDASRPIPTGPRGAWGYEDIPGRTW